MTEKSFSGARVLCPSCGKPYYQDQPWKRVCLACYLNGKSKTASPARTAPAAPPIEPGMLKRLVQLCHPDKHGNSAASNIATGYLLALKKQILN